MLRPDRDMHLCTSTTSKLLAKAIGYGKQKLPMQVVRAFDRLVRGL